MNFVLIDDEKNYHDEFRRIASKYIGFDNCSFYYDSEEFFEDLKNRDNYHVDVVFMDIMLNNESGIEIARELYKYNSSILIVFLTNNNTMVYDAFGLNVIKFIYKPVFESKVDVIFQDIVKEIDMKKRIGIKTGDGYISLTREEIVLISRELRKVCFYTCDKKKYISNLVNIKDAFELLDSDNFKMINRSEIVNVFYISKINGEEIYLGKIDRNVYISKDKASDILNIWREKCTRF